MQRKITIKIKATIKLISACFLLLSMSCKEKDSKERSVTRKYYEKGKLVNTVSKQDTCRMVHCDFRWEGRANGYYVSGIFRDIQHSVEYDDANYPLKSDFNNYIHLVKYDL